MTLFKKIFFQCAVFLLGVVSSHATLRIVDGTGGGGKFATLSEAITAANVGDSIFIQPGTYNEAQTVSVSKRLIIFGNGYRDSLVSTVLMYAIEIADGADGTIIQSLKFAGTGTVLNFASGADNCIVSDCLFFNNQLAFNNTQKDTIRHNIFLSKNPSYALISISGTVSDVVICNNIFDGVTTTTTYGIYTNGAMSNIRIFNNFFSELAYPLNFQQSNAPFIIASNIFFKTQSISTSSTEAAVFSGNWLYNVPNGATMPLNGEANGAGNPQFVRFDETNGFVFTGNVSTDSDLRIKSSASPFPASPIDGGYPPVAPLGAGYVDALQQPGNVNTNRTDGGIFGGPLPFASLYAPATIPSASSIVITPNPVRPKARISVSVNAGFGGDGTLQSAGANQQIEKEK